MIEVVVGRIGRAHGINGEVGIELATDEPDRRFAVGNILGVEGGQLILKVQTKRWHSKRLLVRFEGYLDRSSVEALRGSTLVVNLSENERPKDDQEYYDWSLIGLEAYDHAGVRRGVVTRVVHLPGQELLAIEVAGVERLVPFVKELVPEVDLSAGIIRLGQIAGLLEESS